MTFVSYAQNGEDLILSRVFQGQPTGYYVDVGACWPDHSSVTRAFYDLGWRGLNIEPHPESFERLVHARPRDLNLQVAVSDVAGQVHLYPGKSIGESSIRAQKTAGNGIEVEARTLQSLIDEHVSEDIDFLKIDVEGYELRVLSSYEFSRRPRVVVCEVTEPWSNKKTSDSAAITKLLKRHGYRLKYFDGINNFYLAQEARVSPVFWVQPNAADDYVNWREVTLQDKLKVREDELHALEDSVTSRLAKRAEEVVEIRTAHAEQLQTLNSEFSEHAVALAEKVLKQDELNQSNQSNFEVALKERDLIIAELHQQHKEELLRLNREFATHASGLSEQLKAKDRQLQDAQEKAGEQADVVSELHEKHNEVLASLNKEFAAHSTALSEQLAERDQQLQVLQVEYAEKFNQAQEQADEKQQISDRAFKELESRLKRDRVAHRQQQEETEDKLADDSRKNHAEMERLHRVIDKLKEENDTICSELDSNAEQVRQTLLGLESAHKQAEKAKAQAHAGEAEISRLLAGGEAQIAAFQEHLQDALVQLADSRSIQRDIRSEYLQQIADLDAQLAESVHFGVTVQSELGRLQSVIDHQTKWGNHVTDHLDSVRRRAVDLEQSLSWRITQPLRWVFGWFSPQPPPGSDERSDDSSPADS